MALHSYTFTFHTSKRENVTVTHIVSDDLLLGIGFGVYIYNNQKGLPESEESIHVSGNINLVDEFIHNAIMPYSPINENNLTLEGWSTGIDEE